MSDSRKELIKNLLLTECQFITEQHDFIDIFALGIIYHLHRVICHNEPNKEFEPYGPHGLLTLHSQRSGAKISIIKKPFENGSITLYVYPTGVFGFDDPENSGVEFNISLHNNEIKVAFLGKDKSQKSICKEFNINNEYEPCITMSDIMDFIIDEFYLIGSDQYIRQNVIFTVKKLNVLRLQRDRELLDTFVLDVIKIIYESVEGITILDEKDDANILETKDGQRFLIKKLYTVNGVRLILSPMVVSQDDPDKDKHEFDILLIDHKVRVVFPHTSIPSLKTFFEFDIDNHEAANVVKEEAGELIMYVFNLKNLPKSTTEKITQFAPNVIEQVVNNFKNAWVLYETDKDEDEESENLLSVIKIDNHLVHIAYNNDDNQIMIRVFCFALDMDNPIITILIELNQTRSDLMIRAVYGRSKLSKDLQYMDGDTYIEDGVQFVADYLTSQIKTAYEEAAEQDENQA